MYIGEFQNCKIYKYQTDKTVYEIVHYLSNQILHAISISEAYKIADLLNLDWFLCNHYYGKDKPNEND
jgi:hypothetical protein